MNPLAVGAGALRLASGLSFLIAPKAAGKPWHGEAGEHPTVNLLSRSMGYRDAMIGALLVHAGLGDDPAEQAKWFLFSAGADTADFVGGITNHSRLPRITQVVGNGGAAIGIGVGLFGAFMARQTREQRVAA